MNDNVTDKAIAEEIRRSEDDRCRALVARDIQKLQTLVGDDVVHIHASGNIDDKAAYLLGIEKRLVFLKAAREDYNVIVCDKFAVATGRLRQTVRIQATGQEIDMHVATTQTWAHRDGNWRQITFQATNLPKAPA